MTSPTQTIYSFANSALSVCKVMAVKGYHSQRLGVALTWCIRAKVSKQCVIIPSLLFCFISFLDFSFQDSAFAAFIAEKYTSHTDLSIHLSFYCHLFFLSFYVSKDTSITTRTLVNLKILTCWIILNQQCC